MATTTIDDYNTDSDIIQNTSIKLRSAALSTVDNPFNPFDDFDNWLEYDISCGYNCCGILARITDVDMSELSIIEQNLLIEKAIDNLVNVDPLHVFIKIIDESIVSVADL